MPVILTLVDELLAHPSADAGFIGAGPVEDILHLDGAEDWDEELARRCRATAAWREAVHSALVPDGLSLPHCARICERLSLTLSKHRRRRRPSAGRVGTSGNAAAHIDGRCRCLRPGQAIAALIPAALYKRRSCPPMSRQWRERDQRVTAQGQPRRARPPCAARTPCRASSSSPGTHTTVGCFQRPAQHACSVPTEARFCPHLARAIGRKGAVSHATSVPLRCHSSPDPAGRHEGSEWL